MSAIVLEGEGYGPDLTEEEKAQIDRLRAERGLGARERRAELEELRRAMERLQRREEAELDEDE